MDVFQILNQAKVSSIHILISSCDAWKENIRKGLAMAEEDNDLKHLKRKVTTAPTHATNINIQRKVPITNQTI